MFPATDPIPLPAPVWLFKTLLLLLFTLHLTTVYLLLGGLLAGVGWNFAGHRGHKRLPIQASHRIAARLPTLMTYLINLGVPPLLFTQVLYGQALYTSSILIGAWWIAVPFLVMAVYSCLYSGSLRAADGRPWWKAGLLALALGGGVAWIFSTNMTLMLDPQLWTAAWRSSPHGAVLLHGDPSVPARWHFTLAGACCLGGIGILLTGSARTVPDELRAYMVRAGGALAAAGGLAQIGVARWVLKAQPEAVRAVLEASRTAAAAASCWLILAGAVILIGALAIARPLSVGRPFAIFAFHAGLLLMGAAVVFRDAIREAALLAKGFDSAAQPVALNLPLLILFVVVLAAGLALMGWMIRLIARAPPAGKIAI